MIKFKKGSLNNNTPNNNVLSAFRSIQQNVPQSGSYTPDVNYVEVGFSPQNVINNDIASQLGYFNLGDVIGDPRFQSSSLDTYPALDDIRNSYFQKYISNYQELDYIRLIEFFDNSLFKMFADWVPARTSLASGIIIKQTLLERNRYRVPQVSPSASIAFVGSGSTNKVGAPKIYDFSLHIFGKHLLKSHLNVKRNLKHLHGVQKPGILKIKYQKNPNSQLR